MPHFGARPCGCEHHLIRALEALRCRCQAAISVSSCSRVAMRRSRHWPRRTPISISTMLSQLATSLFHHLSIDLLRLAFFALKREAAPGVDGLTWRDYEADLVRRIKGLHARVHRGVYRALPSRRRYIPKADGQQRPLAVAALEDKIVQGAACAVLNAIYEEDFLGFSYGFRPKRS